MQGFALSREADGVSLVLSAPGRRAITLREDGGPCDALRAGAVPEPAAGFLEAYLAQEAARRDAAARATADQLWAQYCDGWRQDGAGYCADKAAFAAALGQAALTLLLDPEGAVVMAELHWDNRALFWGHSIFTSVFDPLAWDDFDATLFG